MYCIFPRDLRICCNGRSRRDFHLSTPLLARSQSRWPHALWHHRNAERASLWQDQPQDQPSDLLIASTSAQDQISGTKELIDGVVASTVERQHV
jgi:hypothetical protein